uniref:Arrestin C-terminal-like domain-containing protein n=1 Tax=Acrobeloides nanus TaxID=290746 RepID=A0A914CBH3_9BILA
MVKTNIQIFYDSSTNVYAPGQLVHGNVIIELEEEMKARAVVLHMVGKAVTNWSCHEHREIYTDSSGNRQTRSRTEAIKDNEVYMENKTILWDGGADEILPEGSHRYDFSFNLPLICPPSFEGNFGYIRYYCSVKIDRPWRFDEKEISAFSVLPFFDLNTIPYSISPVMKESTKNLGFICKHGRIYARIIIPKTGYVPGETIWAQIEMKNMSSRDIEGIEVSLMELSRFHGHCSYSGHGASKTHSRLVAKSRKEVVIQGKQTLTEQISLQVPPVVPSFNNCRIIQVDYQFKVEIEAHGFLNNSLKIEIPILIGTYPLNNIPIDTLTDPSRAPDHLTPPQPTAPPMEMDNPPPTYGESIFGPEKMENEDEDATNFIGFKPKYRYFPLAGPTMDPISFPQGSIIEDSKSDDCCVIS